MVAISQVYNQELSIPDLLIKYTQLRDDSVDQYNGAVKTGQDLLQRLAVPVLTREG